jgi:steroid delta-isomerase-like uncharacterized protein
MRFAGDAVMFDDSPVPLVGRQLIDAWNAHDPDRILALHATDFVGTDVTKAQPILGMDGIRGVSREVLQAFPDFRLTVDEAIVENDRIVLRWTANGTHRAPLMRIPATNREMCVQGVWILHTSGTQIQHVDSIWDVAAMLRCFGLMPDL